MLTKAQKEMLEMMRDKGAYIYKWNFEVAYTLLNPSKDGQPYNDNKIKNIRPDWFYVLRPFFREEKDPGYAAKRYYLREDAEISDEWLKSENERIAQAKLEKEHEEQRQKAFRKAWAMNWINAGHGPYQIDISGDWPFGGGIYFNGEKIADIQAVHYSTRDETFEDVLKRKENIPHFEAIKEMVRRANKGE